jgi:hypothetical protein
MIAVDYDDLDKYLSYLNDDNERWKELIGSKVSHDTFGRGTICEIKINGEYVYLQIDFSNNLKKRFTPHSFATGHLKELTITNNLQSLQLEVQERYHKGLIIDFIESQKTEQYYRHLLKKYRIESLWYITHIMNLSSIFKLGICSRDYIISNDVNTEDISDARVQRRRGALHEYVNLYFADNTPMLYNSIKDYGSRIILLELDPYNILNGKIVITDGNAAASDTQMYDTLETGLEALDIDTIHSRDYDWEKKREKMAEILVNGKIDSPNIRKIHVQTDNLKVLVKQILNNMDLDEIEISSDLTRKGVVFI